MKDTKEKNMTYEFKINGLLLGKRDEEKIIKLASKIENKKSIAEKLKKPSYNTPIMLLATITRRKKNEEKTITLLHHAISHKNAKAVMDVLEEAKKQKLLKEVLNEEMTTKYSDGREETHTILTDAISRRGNDMIRVVLKISKESGVLKGIVKKRITIKHSNSKETTYTPFTYADVKAGRI